MTIDIDIVPFPKRIRHLSPGDVVLNHVASRDGRDRQYPVLTVKRVEAARARGYFVITFECGARTSGHGDNHVMYSPKAVRS